MEVNEIKKKMLIALCAVVCAVTAMTAPVAAQYAAKDDEEDRRIQGFVGYSFARSSGDKSVSRRVFGTGESNKNLNGVNAAGTFYFAPRFGITADFSAHFDKDDVRINPNSFSPGLPATTGNARFRTQQYNYLVGPQYRFTNKSKVTPFARFLVGGQTNRLKIDGAGIGKRSDTRTNFALAVGGGVDVNVSDRFALRVIQVDYLPSFERDRSNFLGTERRFEGKRTDAVRFSFGIVIK